MKKQETPEVSGFERAVDRLFSLEGEIEALKSEADVIEADLKEEGTKLIAGFGSVNLKGSSALAQIQKRRPSISVSGGNIAEAQKLLGDRFGMFFDSVTDGVEELRRDKAAEVKKILVSLKRDPSDFFTVRREARANDTFLKEEVRAALLGKKAKEVFERLMALVNVKGAFEGVMALKWVVKKA